MLIQGTTDDIKLNWLADTIRTTQGKARYWRTAIIAKTQEECEALCSTARRVETTSPADFK